LRRSFLGKFLRPAVWSVCLKAFTGGEPVSTTGAALHSMSQRASNHRFEKGETSDLASLLHGCLGSGIVVIDEGGRILCCTPEAERLLRLAPGKTVDRDLSALPAAIQKLAREAASTQAPVPNRVVSLTTGKDALALRASVFPFAGSAGKVQAVIVLNDLAVIDRIEKNVHHLDRLASLGTLSAGMAHEIKNAFVAVKTFVDLLLDKNRDAELADVVRREMRRIDSIVSQMLRFGAPARPSFSAVRVHDVLDHSLRMLQHQFEGKLISLNREFNAVHDSIKGDDYQLEQAFLNLFLNALEAMGPNGSLTVATDVVHGSASREGQSRDLRVTVADNGIGIEPQNMPRVYEPFFTTKKHGTGLGLAIVQRIVREHHGNISVQSEPNKGTTVRIILPAALRAA
jgi:two-component system, NtrC family, nitrogen regulation sensor histidine kinase GlnL